MHLLRGKSPLHCGEQWAGLICRPLHFNGFPELPGFACERSNFSGPVNFSPGFSRGLVAGIRFLFSSLVPSVNKPGDGDDQRGKASGNQVICAKEILDRPENKPCDGQNNCGQGVLNKVNSKFSFFHISSVIVGVDGLGSVSAESGHLFNSHYSRNLKTSHAEVA